MATKKKAGKAASAKRKTTSAKKKSSARTARTGSGSRGKLSIRSVSPSFTVGDIERSMAWYRDVLGFAVTDRWENEGKLMGVEIAAGEVTFMIGQDDWKKGRDRVKGEGVRLYCTTGQDIDRLAAAIKAAGGRLSHEPRDEWGMRVVSVEDLDGFKITIARKLKSR